MCATDPCSCDVGEMGDCGQLKREGCSPPLYQPVPCHGEWNCGNPGCEYCGNPEPQPVLGENDPSDSFKNLVLKLGFSLDDLEHCSTDGPRTPPSELIMRMVWFREKNLRDALASIVEEWNRIINRPSEVYAAGASMYRTACEVLYRIKDGTTCPLCKNKQVMFSPCKMCGGTRRVSVWPPEDPKMPVLTEEMLFETYAMLQGHSEDYEARVRAKIEKEDNQKAQLAYIEERDMINLNLDEGVGATLALPTPPTRNFIYCPPCKGKDKGFHPITCICRAKGSFLMLEKGLTGRLAVLYGGHGARKPPPVGYKFSVLDSGKYKDGHYFGEGVVNCTVVYVTEDVPVYLIVDVVKSNPTMPPAPRKKQS